jgi:signal transduction histidine kinase/CheY-like chemotaxis protein
MKFRHAIILTIITLLLSPVFGQLDFTKEYSYAETAIIIDSLENQLTDSINIKNANFTFELAILYNQIDVAQAKIYALNYLLINDSISSINNRKTIYGLLANIFEQKGETDSSFYYLSLQAGLVDDSFYEKTAGLISSYLKIDTPESNSKGFWGLSLAELLTLVFSCIILIIVSIYFFIKRKTYRTAESIKNQELELDSMKYQEFNNNILQAVKNNTITQATELEENNAKIAELRKSLKKAEESNYLKNAFLSSMSHQIRTPLSGILGFSDLLETELAVQGNEELYEYAKNIKESGEKLISLISNIIDISSIESNILELNISSCDLNNIIKDVEQNFSFKAKEKDLVFKTKYDTDIPKIEADNSSLVKVLNVVMDNAIKYTNKGFVTISTKYTDKDTVIIEIKDKGVGIDESNLKQLLSSFDHKKHGSSLTYQGHGLGLILANRLIGLMNGSLEINSKIGVGTNVTITLPCTYDEDHVDSDKKPAQIASIISAPEFGIITIFVVEDDRMNRLVIEKMLKKTGEIITAADGEDALKKLEKSTRSGKIYDVMLVDINLPAPWDGILLMKEIRKRYPLYKSVPFIAQTAYALTGDKEIYIDAGFNDYISKPISKTELLTMIQKQLELSKNKEISIEKK